MSAAGVPAVRRGTRPRNPRGQGVRLREEIIDAAMAMVATTGNLAQLTLRAVAKQAGVTAPAIYRHFPDLDHLAAAVVERCFADLAADRADVPADASPVQALQHRLHGYLAFALAHPGHYQVMFGPDPLASLATDYQHSPRRATFESLVQAVARCHRAGQEMPQAEAVRTATLLWATVHGLASLRISRPNFPWPDTWLLLDDAITRILAAS